MLMSAPGKIPATPQALLSLGIAEWGSRGTWPISEANFAKICSIVYDHFDAMYASLPTGWREALLNDTRFLGWLPQYLHSVAVTEKSARAGVSIVGTAEASQYYQPDWSGFQNVTPTAANRSALTRIPRELRRAWLAHPQIPPRSRLRRLLQPATAWSFGARDTLKMEFAAANNCFSWMPFVVDYLSTVEKPRSVESAVEDIFRTSVDSMCAEFEAHLHVRADRDNILRTWLSRISTYHAHIQAILKWKSRPKLSLFSGMGNAANRTMAAAGQLSGDRVVVFHHGHNPGYTLAAPFSYVEFSLASEYVTATSGISRALSAVNEAMPPSRTRNLQFVSMNSSVYETLRGQLRRPRVSSVRRILVTGYPSLVPPSRLGYGYGDFFAFRMLLELEIMRVVRASGYDVAYKAHPETEPEIAEALRGEGTFRCASSFEDAMGQADLVVLTYPLTTAFGLALCSDLPLVMIDLEGRDWMPEIYEKLRRRCVMVPAKFNERNLVSFRISDLLEGIEEAPSLVSDVYFDAYLRRSIDVAKC